MWVCLCGTKFSEKAGPTFLKGFQKLKSLITWDHNLIHICVSSAMAGAQIKVLKKSLLDESITEWLFKTTNFLIIKFPGWSNPTNLEFWGYLNGFFFVTRKEKVQINGTNENEWQRVLKGIHRGPEKCSRNYHFQLCSLKQAPQGILQKRWFLFPESCCLHMKVIKLHLLKDILRSNNAIPSTWTYLWRTSKFFPQTRF